MRTCLRLDDEIASDKLGRARGDYRGATGVISVLNTLLVLGVLLSVPIGLGWQLVWTLRRGRLPDLAMLPGVTRQAMPLAFWGYVLGLSLANLLAVTILVVVVTAALGGRSG